MKIPITRILCPVDFSANAEHALQYAISMAETFQSKLQLLHVITPPISSLPEDPMIVEIIQNQKGIKDACMERLEKLSDPIVKMGIDTRLSVRNGIPFIEIIRFAHEEKCDMIIMGTHGRTGITHLIIGSCAERVVRKADCPVLTIKHPEHKFVMP